MKSNQRSPIFVRLSAILPYVCTIYTYALPASSWDSVAKADSVYRQTLLAVFDLNSIPRGGEAKDLAIEFGCNRSWRHRVPDSVRSNDVNDFHEYCLWHFATASALRAAKSTGDWTFRGPGLFPSCASCPVGE